MAPVQQNCPNREVILCCCRNPNNSKITTVAEAQELIAIHFALCITNPDLILKRLERQTESAHTRQMDEAAEAQTANKLRPGDQRATPTPQPLIRPTANTKTTSAENRQLTNKPEFLVRGKKKFGVNFGL